MLVGNPIEGRVTTTEEITDNSILSLFIEETISSLISGVENSGVGTMTVALVEPDTVLALVVEWKSEYRMGVVYRYMTDLKCSVKDTCYAKKCDNLLVEAECFFHFRVSFCVMQSALSFIEIKK